MLETGRECARCLVFKEWDEYKKSKTGKNGRYAYCKSCASLRDKEYRSRPEVQRRNKRQMKIWRENNKEYFWLWREQHPDYHAEWIQKHPEKVREYGSNRVRVNKRKEVYE